MMYLDLDPDYPEVWKLAPVLGVLRDGGLGVIPTDTNYAFCCLVGQRGALERLYQIKDMARQKPLSIVCRDLQMVSEYTRGFPHQAFRTVRRCLPGPYTFILNANSQLPKVMLRKRREVGVRIPDDPVVTALMEELDVPLVCSSVRTDDESFWNRPAEIAERYGKRLDFVVDAGERLAEPSTVVDLTGEESEVIRVGKGDASPFQ